MKRGKETYQWGKGQRGHVSKVKGSEGNGKRKGHVSEAKGSGSEWKRRSNRVEQKGQRVQKE